MKNYGILLICVCCITTVLNAQIGIGTSSPQSTLDVHGTVRITSLPESATTDITLTGSTASKTLNRTALGANLIIVDNSLNTAPVSGYIGSLNLGVIPISSGSTFFALDLAIDPEEANSRATFIRLHSYYINLNVGGITGGTDGRRVTLYFSESNGINFLENSILALPRNRILTSANSQLSLNGESFIELVYDDDAGADGLGRWLVIKFRG